MRSRIVSFPASRSPLTTPSLCGWLTEWRLIYLLNLLSQYRKEGVLRAEAVPQLLRLANQLLKSAWSGRWDGAGGSLHCQKGELAEGQIKTIKSSKQALLSYPGAGT